MKARLLAHLKDDFIRHNLVFFVGSVIVAALNYLYHPVMSRMLSVEDFGEVQVLFSILGLVGVPLGIFNMIALNLYTNNNSYKSPVVQQFSLLTAYVAGITALLLIAFTPFITSLLQLSSGVEILIVASCIILSAVTIFGRAHLQATHRFGITSIANAIGAGGKLLASALLVSLGFTVTGAIGGLFIASLISLFYIKHYAKEFLAFPTFSRLRLTPELKKEIHFGFIVLCGTGLITFLTMADVIFAKYMFTPEDAGFYSGIAVVGRVVLFLTSSITGVLLTHVRISATTEGNRTYLRKGLLLTGLIGGSALLIFILAPKLVVSTLVGATYADQSSLLPLLSTFVFIVSLINVCINYSIALRQKYVITIGIFGILCTILFVLILPSTPVGLVQGFLLSSFLTLALCLYIQFKKAPQTPTHAQNIPQKE
jgi:O-antigen/teichoic acid export membrane protein